MATQNPLEMEGTYPLPEAQLDRFFYKLVIPSPDDDLLAGIVTHTTGIQRERSETAQQVEGLTFEELQYLQSLPLLVETPESALNFAVALCQTLNPVNGRPSGLSTAAARESRPDRQPVHQAAHKCHEHTTEAASGRQIIQKCPLSRDHSCETTLCFDM